MSIADRIQTPASRSVGLSTVDGVSSAVSSNSLSPRATQRPSTATALSSVFSAVQTGQTRSDQRFL